MRHLSDIVLNQRPLTMPAETSVKEACEHMRDRGVGSVLVVDRNDNLVGIFTGRDAVCRVLADGHSPAVTKLHDVMTRNPVTMAPQKVAIDALRMMWDGGFRHVPVVEGGKILGVVTRGSIKGYEQHRLDEERELWEHMR
ncbi:MAG: CBS domain-containing protein [Alphaproteobacteria bacterium]|nr:CBS domain-containing protein [Alphaproteobacteria bacterium]